MSDKNKQNNTISETWKPLDLASLQHIEEKSFIKTDRTAPDYTLFKRIYEDTEKDVSKEIFKPLYEYDSDHDTEGVDDEHGFRGLLSEHDLKESALPHGGNDSASELNADAGDNNNVKADDTGKADGNVKYDDSNVGLSVRPESDSEFKQIKDKGFDEGFDKGKEDGFNQGRIEGEKQGYADGYEKGDNEARKSCDAKSLETLASLEDILFKTNDAWTALVKKYENEILSLVCKIAEKVVLARVEVDDSLVKESIFYAMEKLPEPEEIILHVSNDDYEYIEMIKEDFFEKIKGLTSVSVVSDQSINRGGCRIESLKAKIETDIESRLEAVFSSIVKAGAL